MTMYNKKFMELALENAKKVKTDIPVCAVVVKDDCVLSLKSNEKEKTNKVTSHAEILALNEANEKLKNWRLDGCDMYVTLEPCPMCAWAILNSRIENLYFGSFDLKYGGFSTALNLKSYINSQINIQGGMMEKECDKILEEYFKELRNENRTR